MKSISKVRYKLEQGIQSYPTYIYVSHEEFINCNGKSRIQCYPLTYDKAMCYHQGIKDKDSNGFKKATAKEIHNYSLKILENSCANISTSTLRSLALHIIHENKKILS